MLLTIESGEQRLLVIHFHQDPVEKPSVPSQSAYQRIRQYVGDAPGLGGETCLFTLSVEQIQDQKKAEAITSERVLKPVINYGTSIPKH